MKLFLLDGGGAFIPAIGSMFLFIILAILIEAIIMAIFKLNRFSKCTTDSIFVNLASLVAGFFLVAGASSDKWLTPALGLIIIFVVTVLIEGFILKALNPKLPYKKIWLVTLVMNLVSYGVLLLFIKPSDLF